MARTRFRTGDAFPSPSDVGAYDRRQLLTLWGLRYCSNCNRLWCRDKNATHNLFSRMVFLLQRHQELLLLFQRANGANSHLLTNNYWTMSAYERAHEFT
ncbi:hypothetical protein V1527DRAFT_457226 [Lipomyces starkeyi]